MGDVGRGWGTESAGTRALERSAGTLAIERIREPVTAKAGTSPGGPGKVAWGRAAEVRRLGRSVAVPACRTETWRPVGGTIEIRRRIVRVPVLPSGDTTEVVRACGDLTELRRVLMVVAERGPVG